MTDAAPPAGIVAFAEESRELRIRVPRSTFRNLTVQPNAGYGIYITSSPYRQPTAEERAAAAAAIEACWQAVRALDPDSRAWVLRAVGDRSTLQDREP